MELFFVHLPLMSLLKHAIIVAGGIGSRMQASTPKQFLLLEDRPVLMHTLEAFYSYDSSITLTVVLPKEHVTYWQQLIDTHRFTTPHQITHGGRSRFESVRNGLSVIDSKGLVAVHDGARPLISSAVIARTFDQAEKHGNATAAVAIKDSLRRVSTNQNHAVDRSEYVSIQTPQTFNISLIKAAFAHASHDQFTDDASVLEHYGETINLVEGDYANLKITTPEDIWIAEAILKSRKK